MFSKIISYVEKKRKKFNVLYNYLKIKITLQVQQTQTKKKWFRRALQFAPFDFRANCGSMTLEAAFILPLIIYLFVGFFGIAKVVIADEEISRGMTETARQIARYAYLYEEIEAKHLSNSAQNQDKLGEKVVKEVVGIPLAKKIFGEYVNESLLTCSGVKGGLSGIGYQGSKFMLEKDLIELKLQYKVRVPIPLIGTYQMKFAQQIKQKAYTGYKEEKYEDEEYVYVTENGSVYHTSRNCTHIKLSISQYERGSKRQGNLPECTTCKNKHTSETNHVYITDEGDCYHNSILCSRLKRTVYRVKKSEVGGMAKCSRCGS